VQAISKPRERENPGAAVVRQLLAQHVIEIAHTSVSHIERRFAPMVDTENPHLRLQQQIDCQLETNAREALKSWERAGWNEEPGTDVDEAPLKYMALVLLDAIEERAARFAVDKDNGVTVYADSTYTLPQAPPHLIARGLELVREMIGLEGPAGQGTLALGIRNDSLELVIQKQAGLHMINIPGMGSAT
jgi:hypothetical protein